VPTPSEPRAEPRAEARAERRPPGPGDYTYLESRTPERWAYLAGLFLGEGCFSVGDQDGVPSFELKIAMTDRAVTEALAAEFGGASMGAGNAGTGRRFKDAFAWRVTDGFLAVELAQRMLPYMVGEKAEQGAAFLRFARVKLKLWQQRQADGRARYTTAERLILYHLAYAARIYAGGGTKQWIQRWHQRLNELATELAA
jgi:hypothetical protein